MVVYDCQWWSVVVSGGLWLFMMVSGELWWSNGHGWLMDGGDVGWCLINDSGGCSGCWLWLVIDETTLSSTAIDSDWSRPVLVIRRSGGRLWLPNQCSWEYSGGWWSKMFGETVFLVLVGVLQTTAEYPPLSRLSH